MLSCDQIEMATTASLIVTLLAERSTAELEGIREMMRADLSRLQVELEQIEAALALQQAARSQRSPSGAPSHGKMGAARQRILAIVGDIAQALDEDGGPPVPPGSLYSAIRRLRQEGTLDKVGHGVYALPSRNGIKPASVNGSYQEPLTEATSLAGGYGEDAPPTPNDGPR